MSTSNSAEGEDLTYSRVSNSISERFKKLDDDTQKLCSIYKVPRRLRELNEDAYTPRLASIGPIHYGQENLQVMEVHKTRYMRSFFKRTRDPDLTLSECLKEMQGVVDSACSYYSEGLSEYEHVAEVLLVDGCFLLELFLRYLEFPDNYSEILGDPILIASTICSLQRDLALLENQIPFFVLQRLFRHLPNREQLGLPRLCASFFDLELKSNESSSDYMHLLDLIRKCYLPRQPRMDPNENKQARQPRLDFKKGIRSKQRRKKKSWELIHCVTKLRECGIKFVKGNSENLFHIKFSVRKGELEIPVLRITDTMDSLLRNMLAFEQCFEWTSSHDITSYAILMDYFIDSPADTEFLQHRRIIANYLGHGEEVSNIFNKISKKVFVKTFYFAGLCTQVNEYCDKCWPRRRESLVRDYFYSPWKVIGVFAASILLLFTGLQTGYTMASPSST